VPGAVLRSALSGEEIRVTDGTIRVATALAKLPANVLTN